MTTETQELAVVDRTGRQNILFKPESPKDMVARVQEIREYVGQAMKDGLDYMTIPGTGKPSLIKAGAENLCIYYQLSPVSTVTHRVEDWERGFFHYEVRVDLVSRVNGEVMGNGIGSCNSKEDKYRWRNAEPTCPTCGVIGSIIKGKEEYGGGWICWQKRGGCGAKFPAGDPQILNQPTGKVENPEPYTMVNTILKMAKKRAFIDAVLTTTGASMMFTQDVEDFAAGTFGNDKPTAAQAQRQQGQGSRRGQSVPPQPVEAQADDASFAQEADSDYEPGDDVREWHGEIEKCTTVQATNSVHVKIRKLFNGTDLEYLEMAIDARRTEIKEMVEAK